VALEVGAEAGLADAGGTGDHGDEGTAVEEHGAQGAGELCLLGFAIDRRNLLGGHGGRGSVVARAQLEEALADGDQWMGVAEGAGGFGIDGHARERCGRAALGGGERGAGDPGVGAGGPARGNRDLVRGGACFEGGAGGALRLVAVPALGAEEAEGALAGEAKRRASVGDHGALEELRLAQALGEEDDDHPPLARTDRRRAHGGSHLAARAEVGGGERHGERSRRGVTGFALARQRPLDHVRQRGRDLRRVAPDRDQLADQRRDDRRQR
jgi:hypothetical protein